MIIFVGFIVFAFAVLCLFAFIGARLPKTEVVAKSPATPAKKRPRGRYAQAQDDASRVVLTPIVADIGVIPHSGELFYREYRNIEQIVERHHSEYVGRSSGASIRVARGLRLYSGSSHGRKVDVSEMVIEDKGTLVFSNQRVVFIGKKHAVTAALSHIVSAVDLLDAVRIDRDSGPPLWFKTSEQNLAALLRRIAASDFNAPQTAKNAVAVQYPEIQT